MPEPLLDPPDVVGGIIARIKAVLPASPPVTVTDSYPLNGAHGTKRLIEVEATGTDLDPRFTSQYDVTLNVWAGDRKESLALTWAAVRAITTRGGFRLDVNGVVVRAACTLRPAREPAGSEALFVRHIARLDTFVRSTSTT